MERQTSFHFHEHRHFSYLTAAWCQEFPYEDRVELPGVLEQPRYISLTKETFGGGGEDVGRETEAGPDSAARDFGRVTSREGGK